MLLLIVDLLVYNVDGDFPSLSFLVQRLSPLLLLYALSMDCRRLLPLLLAACTAEIIDTHTHRQSVCECVREWEEVRRGEVS